MSEAEKIYIVAIRQGQAEPENWQTRLIESPGITLISAIGRYVRIRATPKAIQAATTLFGRKLIIEEELPRYL